MRVPESCKIYTRTQAERDDQQLSWDRTDRAFFAAGACHVLAMAAAASLPGEACEVVVLKPASGFEGLHAYLRKGAEAFDFNGWSLEADLLAVARAAYGSAWVAEPVVYGSGEALYSENPLRRPVDFAHDPTDRARRFARGEAALYRVATSDGAEQSANIVRQLLGELPEWFGIAEANEAYIEAAGSLQTIVASVGSTVVGALVLKRHFEQAAEIELIAVSPEWHRFGVGRMLVAEAEVIARSEGRSLLSVKTLGPSHPDLGYADTRRFYDACGFISMEETLDLWGPDNPALIMVKPLAA